MKSVYSWVVVGLLALVVVVLAGGGVSAVLPPPKESQQTAPITPEAVDGECGKPRPEDEQIYGPPNGECRPVSFRKHGGDVTSWEASPTTGRQWSMPLQSNASSGCLCQQGAPNFRGVASPTPMVCFRAEPSDTFEFATLRVDVPQAFQNDNSSLRFHYRDDYPDLKIEVCGDPRNVPEPLCYWHSDGPQSVHGRWASAVINTHGAKQVFINAVGDRLKEPSIVGLVNLYFCPAHPAGW